MASGTTLTNPLQSIDNGNIDEVLTSNGPGILPSFQPTTGSGAYSLLTTRIVNDDTEITFDNTFITGAFNDYFLIIAGLVPVSNSSIFMQISDDNGATWIDAGYESRVMNQVVNFGSNSFTDAMYLTGAAGTGNATNSTPLQGYSGQIYINNITGGTIPRFLSWGSHLRSGGGMGVAMGAAFAPDATTGNAIRIMGLTSDLSTGQISLYGVNI